MKDQDIYKTETYVIETLSPVHIGTGIKLDRTDFFISNRNGDKILHRISIDNLIEVLPEEKSLKLVENFEKGIGINELIDILSHSNKEKIILYTAALDINYFEYPLKSVHEILKHPKGLYIPASTIKGAIRTAILYSLLNDHKDNYFFDVQGNQIILKNKNGKPLATGTNDKDYNSIQNYLNRKFFGKDPTSDILKYLKISDSSLDNGFHNLGCKIVYVANTTTYHKKPPEYYEVISEESEFENISFSYINDVSMEQYIKGEYKNTLNKLKNWKHCVYEFSERLIDEELNFWDKENVKESIQKAINNIKYNKDKLRFLLDNFNKNEIIRHLEYIQKQNTPDEPVIRLGKLTGYFTHSIGLLLAENSEKSYNIKKFGKAIARNRAKKWLFPLTRRLTLDNQTLGWCKLKKNPTKLEKENNTKQPQEKIEKVNEEAVKKLAQKLGGRFRK